MPKNISHTWMLIADHDKLPLNSRGGGGTGLCVAPGAINAGKLKALVLVL